MASLLDTVSGLANTGGNILNAAAPFLRVGGSIYDRNKTKKAINSGFNEYKGYADRSLNTLKTNYEEGKTELSPYLTAGKNSLTRYQNLLTDPNQIKANPGYQFGFNQGKEAVNTSAGTGRMLNSSNRLLALDQFGQDYGMQEFDKALSRELPMVNVGQNATGRYTDLGRNYTDGVVGINKALGEAAAGKNLGEAGADSRMVTDLLGLTGGSNLLTDTAGALKTTGQVLGWVDKLISGGKAVGTLANAGGGNPLSAISLTGKETLGKTGSWADLGAGPRRSLASGGNTLSGAAAAAEMAGAVGSLPAWYTAGATPATTYGGAYTTALGDAVGASTASKLSSTTNFLSSTPGMGIVAGVLTGIATGNWQKAALVGGGTYAGAAAGTAILPGIGTMIGGVLGGLLGGKIGPQPSDKAQGISIDPSGNIKQWGALGGSKFSPDMRKAADALGEQLSTMQKTIKSVFPGVKFSNIGATFGERDGLRLNFGTYGTSPSVKKYGYNQKAFAQGVAEALTSSMGGLTAKQIEAIGKVNFSDLALAEQQLNYIKAGQF